MFKKLLAKVSDRFMRVVRRRQLETLRKQIMNGAIFLRVLNDELRKLERHKRRRFIESLYQDGKVSDEIIQYVEHKAEYIIGAMKGKLQVYKKQKSAQSKANMKKMKEMKDSGQIVKHNPEKTTVDGKDYKPQVKKVEAVDGAEYYKNLKEKEAKGELPEQKPCCEGECKGHTEQSPKVEEKQ